MYENISVTYFIFHFSCVEEIKPLQFLFPKFKNKFKVSIPICTQIQCFSYLNSVFVFWKNIFRSKKLSKGKFHTFLKMRKSSVKLNFRNLPFSKKLKGKISFSFLLKFPYRIFLFEDCFWNSWLILLFTLAY